MAALKVRHENLNRLFYDNFLAIKSTSDAVGLHRHPALDSILGTDGYSDKSTILIVGPPGIGKEALGYWFTQSGLSQNDFYLYLG